MYIVICRNDRKEDGTKGDYGLATRNVFFERSTAECYVASIAPSREPIMVEGEFGELRFQPPKQET